MFMLITDGFRRDELMYAMFCFLFEPFFHKQIYVRTVLDLCKSVWRECMMYAVSISQHVDKSPPPSQGLCGLLDIACLSCRRGSYIESGLSAGYAGSELWQLIQVHIPPTHADST